MIPVQDYEEIGRFTVVVGNCRYSIPRHCPHRAGRLDHGFISSARGTVSCPLHHSVFDLATGMQLAGPPCGDISVHAEQVQAIPMQIRTRD
ncbi:3-phenylpropionate dioxygenase ferredoxin subunit [Bordetella ansorpii]|uniref:3-phenylpropionate dioxygenase ferredoxin subunit n=1 Tax=Bordetella ansorpii TaxID=288768 RepID=A0A157SS21_9BORD|nr:Rieske 2Fe-2S domain-containing protein [Bordetella ansorpii]SAI73101.1 3-phenylpropionate dioxygenase ferredoxin subunit [Bordetella ansorpii]